MKSKDTLLTMTTFNYTYKTMPPFVATPTKLLPHLLHALNKPSTPQDTLQNPLHKPCIHKNFCPLHLPCSLGVVTLRVTNPHSPCILQNTPIIHPAFSRISPPCTLNEPSRKSTIHPSRIPHIHSEPSKNTYLAF